MPEAQVDPPVGPTTSATVAVKGPWTWKRIAVLVLGLAIPLAITLQHALD